MLHAKPTKNLLGITIEGDYNDFNQLVDSIYRITGLDENFDDSYYGVKMRLLGVCYEIRHGFMGDRGVFMKKNGMRDEIMKYLGIITPKENVYFSTEIFFPEAIFIACAVPQMSKCAISNYGKKGQWGGMVRTTLPLEDYLRDKANLDVLCSAIWQALGEAIGEDGMESIVRSLFRNTEEYADYVTHYIDRCNVELCKCEVEKRKDKIKNITKRIMKKNQTYIKLEKDLNYWAKEMKVSVYDLKDPKVEYPEGLEW